MVVNRVGALGPSLNFGWDIESLPDVFSVHVVGEVVSKNGFFFKTEGTSFEPRCVLRHGHSSLVSLDLAINDR